MILKSFHSSRGFISVDVIAAVACVGCSLGAAVLVLAKLGCL